MRQVKLGDVEIGRVFFVESGDCEMEYFYRVDEDDYVNLGDYGRCRRGENPLALDMMVTVTDKGVIINDEPTAIESAAVMILSKAVITHPGLAAWVRAMYQDPNERRDLNRFVFETVPEESEKTWAEVLREAGYVAPTSLYSGGNVFTAIMDGKPKGEFLPENSEAWGDEAVLRLADAVRQYREAGRPNEGTYTIRSGGVAVMMRVAVNLAAEVAEYHERIVNLLFS